MKRCLAIVVIGLFMLVGVGGPVQAHQRYAKNCASGPPGCQDPDQYDECWKSKGGTADIPLYQILLGGNRQLSTNLYPLAWGIGTNESYDNTNYFCIQDTDTDDANKNPDGTGDPCTGCTAGNRKSEPGEDSGFLWVYATNAGAAWVRAESHCGAFGLTPVSLGTASVGTSNAYQGSQPRGVYAPKPQFCFAAVTKNPLLKDTDIYLNATSNTAWAQIPSSFDCTPMTQTPCKDDSNAGIRIPVPIP